MLKINTKKLFVARAQAGFTTEEIAQKADIGTKTYSRIENGHTNPNAATIGKIAKALNVQLETLFINE